jgi:hypothetical protein
MAIDQGIDSPYRKRTAHVKAVVFGGTMTLLTVFTTAVVSPTFRKLDLQEDLKEHEK